MVSDSKNKPLVSTITPCYKMEKYLKLFLEKIPEQTYFENIQIVLDHNEPTNEELVWVEEFNKKFPGKIKHLVTNPVIPIGTSMNKCIQESDGNLLTIWNVDDLRTPDSIEKQVECYLKTGCNTIHGNFIIVNKFGSKTGKFIDHSFTLDYPENLLRGMHLGPFFMFEKEILEKSKSFDEQLKSGADFDLALRLALVGSVSMAPGILGYYLDEGLGASTRGDLLQPIERTLIEMRYKIEDKIDQRFIPLVEEKGYDKDNLICYGKKIPVKKIFCRSENKEKF